MHEDPVVIAEFSNPFEAEMVKNRLEDEGIPAFVGGEAAAGVFSGAGLAVVPLYVPAADRERAMTVLASLEEEPGPATALSPPPALDSSEGTWSYCPRCGSEVSSGFRVCSTCGAPIAVPKNGFLAPPASSQKQEEPHLSPSDDLAARAWRAAVFGLITLPFIFHLYSFWLLGRFIFTEGDVSGRSWLKAIGALFIDCFVFFVPVYFFRVFVT
jgi:hypothetical protein